MSDSPNEEQNKKAVRLIDYLLRLADLRDTLLPKFLSGEVELPKAEAIAEEVL